MNPIIISVCVMLLLALMRVNVVVALVFSALVGGLLSDMTIHQIIQTFESGLGGGATIALGYAMLGAFAVAISKSGITDLLAHSIIKKFQTDQQPNRKMMALFKYGIMIILVLVTMSSQNIIPVHIAFIPILIPPLLAVFNKLRIDRRLIACILTFGLITPYMILPVGFGGIFLNNILLTNLQQNGLSEVTAADLPIAMLLPALGMLTGLLMAVFVSYRKPREYLSTELTEPDQAVIFNKRHLLVASISIVVALSVQLAVGSMIVGGLAGFIVLTIGGVIKWKETTDVFTQGVHMMAMIGFIMLSAAGFAAVMKQTGGVESLVAGMSDFIGDNKAIAALLMLVVGLLVTMGIGSSFSTIPILATIYVPLALSFGFSPMATAALVGTAAALGDAGSPASDSTLGPTSGLNSDGQHEHIWQTVVPTFIHYNLPLIIFGWIGAMTL